MSSRLAFGAFASVFAMGALGFGGNASVQQFGDSGEDGPGFWADPSDSEACAGSGTNARQSPIDFDEAVFDSQVVPPRLHVRETPSALINNGHVIEEEYGRYFLPS